MEYKILDKWQIVNVTDFIKVDYGDPIGIIDIPMILPKDKAEHEAYIEMSIENRYKSEILKFTDNG